MSDNNCSEVSINPINGNEVQIQPTAVLEVYILNESQAEILF